MKQAIYARFRKFKSIKTAAANGNNNNYNANARIKITIIMLIQEKKNERQPRCLKTKTSYI